MDDTQCEYGVVVEIMRHVLLRYGRYQYMQGNMIQETKDRHGEVFVSHWKETALLSPKKFYPGRTDGELKT